MIPFVPRKLNRGTFMILVVVSIMILASNLAATAAIVYITINGRTPAAILGALAMAGFDRLLVLGERAFRWTKDADYTDEEDQ